MAYIPKEWETGDVITASDLNHIENAIGTLSLTTTESDNVVTLLATYNEIVSAVNAGKNVIINTLDTAQNAYYINTLVAYGFVDNLYYVTFKGLESTDVYTASDADTNLTLAQNPNG